jgi:hypothetical protein
MKTIVSLLAVFLWTYASHAQSFTKVGSWSEATCRAVAYADPLVYHANGPWVEIVDISNLTEPQSVGRLELPSPAEIMAVHGGALYVASWSRQFFVVDVRNPSEPVLVRELPIRAYAVELIDSNLITTNGRDLKFYDIGNPLEPVEVAAFDAGRLVESLSAEDDVLVAGLFTGILILNIEDPSGPQLVATVPVDNLRDVSFQGDRIYAATDSLVVFDISDPQAPLVVYKEAHYQRSLQAVGNRLYTFDNNSRLKIYDLADPNRPVYVATYQTAFPRTLSFGGSAQAVFTPELALLADVELGVDIVDVRDPANPSELTVLFGGGVNHDVSVAGDLALVATGGAGLLVLDIADPANPKAVQRFRDLAAQRVVARDQYAFVAALPTAILEFRDGGYSVIREWDFRSTRVVVDANRAYFVARRPREDIAVVDISRPAVANEIGSIGALGLVEALAASGGIVFAAAHDSGGVSVFDARDAGSPRHLTTFAVEDRIIDLFIHETSLYVGTTGTGLVLDISDPSQPVEVAQLDAPYLAGFEMMNDLLVAISQRDGLYYQDPSLSEPSLVHAVDFAGAGDQLDTSGRLVVTARHETGVSLFQVEGIVTHREQVSPERISNRDVSVFPNPFDRELRFNIPSPLKPTSRLEVFDVTGRQVAVLLAGEKALAGHYIRWDGLSSDGRSLPPGVYVWRYRSRDGIVSGTSVKTR